MTGRSELQHGRKPGNEPPQARRWRHPVSLRSPSPWIRFSAGDTLCVVGLNPSNVRQKWAAREPSRVHGFYAIVGLPAAVLILSSSCLRLTRTPAEQPPEASADTSEDATGNTGSTSEGLSVGGSATAEVQPGPPAGSGPPTISPEILAGAASSKKGDVPRLCRAQHEIAPLPWSSVDPALWSAALIDYEIQWKVGTPRTGELHAMDWARYILGVHDCLHPIFADSFLASLDALPDGHALQRGDLSAEVEIVIQGDTGQLHRIGLERSSGVPVFDAAAVAALSRVFPLDPPPPSLLSSDGRVYMTWEFQRNPMFACSAYFAKPHRVEFQGVASVPLDGEAARACSLPDRGGSPTACGVLATGPPPSRDTSAISEGHRDHFAVHRPWGTQRPEIEGTHQ